jgi:hypothetical protein
MLDWPLRRMKAVLRGTLIYEAAALLGKAYSEPFLLERQQASFGRRVSSLLR